MAPSGTSGGPTGPRSALDRTDPTPPPGRVPVPRRTADGRAAVGRLWETRTIAAPRPVCHRGPRTGSSCPERRPYPCLSFDVADTTRGRSTVPTFVTAALMLLSLALPAGADKGPTKLFDAASADSGTTATTITFSVGYRNREGSAPGLCSRRDRRRRSRDDGDGGRTGRTASPTFLGKAAGRGTPSPSPPRTRAGSPTGRPAGR